VQTSISGPPPPSGFKLGNPATYFDIWTTASYDPSMEICIYYGEISFAKEENLRLFHMVDTSWQDVTAPSSPDILNDIICGVVDSLSTFAIFEANLPPSVGEIAGPFDPKPVGEAITVSASFTDPDTADTHMAIWDWGDSNQCDTTSSDPDCSLIQSDGSGSVSGSHSYTEAGVYTVRLTVTDNEGGSDESVFQFVVVYDPSAGFVTGGGWIDSPEEAYTPDPTLTGKATFGFVSKYKKGASVPTGVTEFQFKVADLNFHSDNYQWLVVTGSNYAMYMGSGTINGEGDYRFMIWAGDDDPDTFRIRIWEEDEITATETTVYDNGFDQAIGGGSIVVHTKKK
jgi:PKD repeat protein